ncbi:unnamed protein product [Laminaria digitata]
MQKPTFNLGRNMDHPHLKGRFTLRFWVPFEQTPVLISSSNGVLRGIVRASSVKSIECYSVSRGAGAIDELLARDAFTASTTYGIRKGN